MFSDAKAGDRVWSFVYNCFGTIEKINNLESRPLLVRYDNGGYDNYYFNGKGYIDAPQPTIFWQEFEIPKEAFIKPLPKLEVDTKVLVWDESGNFKNKKHFSHFDKDGTINCFACGSSSWTNEYTDTVKWKNWELYKEE